MGQLAQHERSIGCTRIALGQVGSAEGIDEEVIEFFEGRGYEISLQRKSLGNAVCTYAEVSPPITESDLDTFGKHLYSFTGHHDIDVEMLITPEKIVISTY